MKTNTADKNRRDLKKLMTTRRDQIDALMAQIRSGVDTTMDLHRADPQNWGYAGNLGHAIEQLDELAKFLGQAGVR